MSTKTNKALFGAIITGALMVGATFSAQALPMKELALVVDASGSINSEEWTKQVKGYSAAITAVLPIDGSIAVSVIRFAKTATVVRSMTTINDAADRDALADFFWTGGTELDQDGNGSLTCISCGIYLAEGTFSGNATTTIIDVSTDGMWNVDVDPNGDAGTVGTAEWAVANAATVLNAIGIGVVPDFAHGPDSFSLFVDSFDDFQSALEQKLATEIDGGPGPNDIPEPGTLALFGLGLAGLGFARRKKAA